MVENSLRSRSACQIASVDGLERAGGVDADVVDQHVDLAELLLGGGEDTGAVLGLADIGRDGDDLALALARSFCLASSSVLVPARDDGDDERPRA